MAGRIFDAQVVLSPKDSPRGNLLSQYVLARIVRMDDVDVALFERDWNNTLYYFILNADEQIYMRYGGRDARAPDSYLNLNSLELALAKGLELHGRYLKGELPKTERPKPFYPRQMPLLVERTFARGACVECHLIGDFQLLQREQEGTLHKLAHMYRSPDIRNIGIELDVPRGLAVKEARGAVEAAGMKAGDRIAALDGTPVWTFGDLQYRYDKVPRTAKEVRIAVDRGGKPVDLTVNLPNKWWLTDLRFRQLSVEPRPEFDSRPLTAEEKARFGLKPDGFAGRVTGIGGFAQMLKIHDLRPGDIVFAVDGAERDDVADTPELFIKLRKSAGDTLTLGVLRDGKRIETQVKSQRMYFRK